MEGEHIATATVTNHLQRADGTPFPNVSVSVRPYPDQPAYDPNGNEIAHLLTTVTDGTGNWTLNLERTDTMQPAGMVYEVHEEYAPDGMYRTSYISVGAAGGTLYSLLTFQPGAVPPAGVLTGIIAGTGITTDGATPKPTLTAANPVLPYSSVFLTMGG